MTGNFLFSTNKFIIARLTGLSFVAYYEIANKIVVQTRAFFQSILEPVYPATSIITSVEGEEGKTRRINAFKKGFKYLLILSSIVYGALFLLNYPIILLWLGERYVQISPIVLIIGIGSYLNLQTAMGFYFMLSLNRLHSAIASAILTLAGNFALSAALWSFFGFYGLLIGFALSQALASGWFIVRSRKEILGD